MAGYQQAKRLPLQQQADDQGQPLATVKPKDDLMIDEVTGRAGKLHPVFNREGEPTGRSLKVFDGTMGRRA